MNHKRLTFVYNKQGQPILPVKPGMRLELHEKVGDGSTERIWKFRGLVLSVKKPQHPDGTFTIRGESARMTVEKIYPLSFPKFEKVILLDEHKVRRSKLYYMREKIGRGARLKSVATADRKNINLLEQAFIPTNDVIKSTEKTTIELDKSEKVPVENKETSDDKTTDTKE